MARRCDLTGVGVLVGNNVSHSQRRTKKRFLPNLQEVKLKSDALNCDITLKVAAKTLRTVNKYGSLDSFLVNYRYAGLADEARKLRKKVKESLVKKGLYEEVKIRDRKAERKAAKEAA